MKKLVETLRLAPPQYKRVVLLCLMMAAALFVACSNGSDDGPSYTETLLIGTSYENESVKYSFDSGESFSGTKITASGKTSFKWVATDDGTVSIKFEDGTEETWTYDYTAQTISNKSGTFNKLLDFAKFSITPSITTIKYDESVELAIDISPSDGVTYDISGGDDFGVQIENGKLKVQGIVTGEAVMQVTAKKPGYNDKTATAKVTVNGNDSMTLSISATTETVWLEDSKEFTLTTNQTSGVTYDVNVTSGAETVEANIENGKLKVTGKKSGAAVVVVTAKKAGYNDKSVTVNLTVKGRDFSSFSVTPATQTVNWGEAINLTVAANPSDGVSYTAEVIGGDGSETVTVSSGNVTVSNLPVGDVTVKVTAQKSGYNDASREAKITVKPLNFTSLAITPDTTIAKIGDNLTLTAAATPAADSYTWRVTSGSDKADVSVSGSTVTVSGKAVGDVTIEVTAKKKGYTDKTATKTLTVQTKTFTTFEIKDSITIFTDETVYFPITISPSDGVTYSVTKTKIATTKGDPVTATVENGKLKVTGNSAGTVSVKVTAKKDGYDNKTFNATVRVNTTPSVGCIVMKDGSYKSAYAITDADKANAIAVVYKVDTTTRTAWIVGKKHKSGDYAYAYPWCAKGSYDTRIYDLITTVSGTEGNYTFDGYIDGSQGLGLFKKIITSLTGYSYTAWNWCDSYGTSDVPSDVDSKFKTGWYFPSIADLYDIWKGNKDSDGTVETALEKSGGDMLQDASYRKYISSSQYSGSGKGVELYVWSLNFTDKNNCYTWMQPKHNYTDTYGSTSGTALCAVYKLTY